MGAQSKFTRYVGTDYVVITPVGALDFYSSPDFRSQVEQALGEGSAVRLLCCDCSQVDFMDSTALGELVRARRAARDTGVRFCIVGASATCRQILHWTQLDTVIPGFDTLAEAIFALDRD
ncbi:MAG TPA: STAS domain-containing protein [Marmoricola sp.]|nr:STAS domain-containing protein [Marmoricola sp.]